MAKIMLVEDDKNLSSIYKDRLLAEGYDIVEAHDGEEALAMAVKEKPDLIVSDVMMPKISGFDMLDILRSTPETKNTKVIMMTALSQTEDQQRATQLGADKYLVKSQVTLDDVARVVREALEGASPVTAQPPEQPIETQAATSPETPSPEASPDNSPPDTSSFASQLPEQQPPEQAQIEQPSVETPTVQLADISAQAPEPTPAPVQSMDIDQLPAQPVAQEKSEIEEEIEQAASKLADSTPEMVMPQANNPNPDLNLAPGNSVEQIEPVVSPDNTSPKPDIMELYEQELAKESSGDKNAENSASEDNKPVDPHSISL